MLNLVNSIVGIVAGLLMWAFFGGLMMLAVRYNGTKKSWKKIKENYPYFSYHFYKKSFFIGLNGAMPLSVVVLSFVVNIALIIIVLACVANMIFMNIVTSYIARISMGIYLIAVLVRFGIFVVRGFKI